MAQYKMIIYGATGFTGQLAADYLAGKIHNQDPTAPKSALEVALAGRSKSKLEKLSASLAQRFKASANGRELYFDIIVADSSDVASVEAMVKQTRVVFSAAGPYIKYGTPVVAACVKHGVHYCDITGEALWNRHMIDQFHTEAQQTGAKIVSFCGMDCIPFDIGTAYLADYVRRTFDCGLGEVQTIAAVENLQISGGTFQTAMGMREHGEPADFSDEYLLNPRDDPKFPPRAAPREQDKHRPVVWRDSLKGWASPFIMSMINTRVVRRSWRLLDKESDSYGENFVYKPEGMAQSNVILALFMLLFTVIANLAMSVPVIRRFLLKYGLQSGDGPSPAQREIARVWIRITGEVDHPNAVAGKKPKAYVDVRGHDLGYTQTAEMAVEAALMLADGEGRQVGGGVWTTAYVFGSKMAERLNNCTKISFKAGTL